MMSLSVNYEKIRVLKRNLRALAWRSVNGLRYRYEGPHKVADQYDPNDHQVEVLWEGTVPQEGSHVAVREPFNSLDEVSFVRPMVLSIKGGRVYSHRGDVITPGGTILSYVTPEIPRRPNKHFLKQKGKMPAPKTIDGNVLVMSCGPYNNYFHFCTEALGRLYFIQQANTPVDYYYLPYAKSFQQQLASIFDIDPEKILEIHKETHLEARNLLVTTLPGLHFHPTLVHLKNKEIYLFLQQRVLSKCQENLNTSYKNMLVCRKGNRTLSNQTDVLKCLAAFGNWQTIFLEDLKVVEQVSVFYHAEMIVAMHGAGLTNMAYCKKGTMIIEIFNPNLIEPIYYQMATCLELNYYPFVGKASNETIKKEKQLGGSVTVPIPELKELLTEIYANKKEAAI